MTLWPAQIVFQSVYNLGKAHLALAEQKPSPLLPNKMSHAILI